MNKLLDLIGNTPMVRIEKMNNDPLVKIYAKLEGFNPTGSVKDRIALAMIAAAEKKGALKPGMTIIEATSGNTGIGVAMVAAMKGYKTIIVMPESMSIERRKMIKAFGAELILVKPEMWRQGAMDLVKDMISRDRHLVTLDQFANQENCRAHYRTTGKEIINQIKGKIDYLICGLGTGGTITGIARRIKEKFPKTIIVGVQPKLGEKIEGLMSTKSGCVTAILAPNLPCGAHSNALIDLIVEVGQSDAFQMVRDLAINEGLFVGASSGAAMYTTMQYANKIKKGTIVTVFPDRGEKYLSTEMFNA